jgi:hypothetical protein
MGRVSESEVTMEYTGPSAADYEDIGWPKTDGFVSNSRDILSTTKAYEAGLFSAGSDYCTILLSVSSLAYKVWDNVRPRPKDHWGHVNPLKVPVGVRPG